MTDLNRRQYDVARDGRFLMIKQPGAALLPQQLVVVTNWLAELRARFSTSRR